MVQLASFSLNWVALCFNVPPLMARPGKVVDTVNFLLKNGIQSVFHPTARNPL